MEYTYNNRGQLVRQTDPDSAVKEYTYDPNGSRETFRLIRSNAASPEISLHYSYDDVNRLQRVRTGGAAGAVISEYDYDANGNRTAMRYPQGNMETVYSYNDANLIVSLENRRNGVRTSAWEYNFFLDGNPSSKIDRTNASRTIRYQYDRIGRLTQESDPDWNTIAYEYDQFSNRSRMTVSGSESYETTYEYQPNNLLVRENKKQDQSTEVLSYRYDANGNQIYREWEKMSSSTTGPGRMDLRDEERADTPAIIDMREYDGFDRLVKVHRPPMSILYRYRPDGLRHGKAVVNPFSGAVHRTIHHWDGENIVLESVNDDTQTRYLYGIDLIARQTDNSLFYYQFNMRGDVVQHTDTTYEYNAFGNERNPVPTDTNPFRYAGEYWDAETSAYYLRFRNYNPGNGRFTQPDPNWNTKNMQENTETILQSGNLYVYTMNNPIIWADPWGLSVRTRNEGAYMVATVRSTCGNVTVSYFNRASGEWAGSMDSSGWSATPNPNRGGTTTSPVSHLINAATFFPGSQIRYISGNGWNLTGRNPGQQFAYKQEAILAWSLIYFPQSGPSANLPYGREFGAWILSNREGQYVLGRTWTFGGENFIVPRIPIGGTAEGWIHTHPRMTTDVKPPDFIGRYYGDRFSGGDVWLTTTVSGVPGFIATPDARVLRLDPGVSQIFWTSSIGIEDSGYVSLYIENIFGSEYSRRMILR